MCYRRVKYSLEPSVRNVTFCNSNYSLARQTVFAFPWQLRRFTVHVRRRVLIINRYIICKYFNQVNIISVFAIYSRFRKLLINPSYLHSDWQVDIVGTSYNTYIVCVYGVHPFTRTVRYDVQTNKGITCTTFVSM